MKVLIATTLALLVLIVQGCAKPQMMFESPDEAANALVGAVRAHNKAQLEQILGPQSDELISSGDEVADQQSSESFLAAYNAKHSLVESDGEVTLHIGTADWPLPIPLIKDEKSGKWSFDTEAGKEEIVCRRIGRNELDVIQVCGAIADAQREYARLDPERSGLPAYAQKFVSDAGHKNGLYWPTSRGEPMSPLGPLVGQAVQEGYGPVSGEVAKPYHGYFYRILISQGPSAPGGELSYVVNGKMIGGFAVIAWPAKYDNSGVMTFLVNHQGIVFQRDLGPGTDALVKAITAYDPGEGWKKAE